MFLKKKNTSDDTKIFIIGFNKTGTTSVEKALRDHGFKLGNQNKALNLIDPYRKRKWKSIINFCKNGNAFQDAPFSWPFTYIPLDSYYRNGKFILTIRDSSTQWYNSIKNFHSKRFGDGINALTYEQMISNNRPDGRNIWDRMTAKFDLNKDDPYNKEILVKYYEDHINQVMEYFRFKSNLLIINISENDSYKKYCEFLNVKPLYNKFPWLNKT